MLCSGVLSSYMAYTELLSSADERLVLTMASGLVKAKYTACTHKTATYVESSTTQVSR